MHLIKTDFNGNFNVGLYAYATDDYCLIGQDVPSELIAEIEKALNVPIHRITIAGTGLLGVFLAGNKNCLLIPKITFNDEIEEIKKLKINYRIIDTKLTALGNNILCNEKGCIINPDFGKTEEETIKEALKVPVKRGKIAGLSIVGALATINKKGCLLHRDAEDFEIEFIEDTLGLKVTTGTVNFGSPYIKSGILANSNGFIIGSVSGGPEIQNADISLGFLDE
jgi:translation initiation factor 6